MSGDIVAASIRDNIVLPLLPEHCPLCFQCGGDIVSWLKSRAIDRKRPNGRILKRILRLGDTSDLNTALHVHGATITDNYWVKTEDEAGLTWADVGFRENYFADLALSGRFSSIAKITRPRAAHGDAGADEHRQLRKMLAAAGRALGHGKERNAGRTFFRDFHGGARQAPWL